MSVSINGTTGITTPTYGGDVTAEYLTPVVGFKNRIINGAMMIDQRNAGASVSITNLAPYTLDRWQAYGSQNAKYTVQQNAGSITPPAGFTNYLGVTSSAATSLGATDYYVIQQKIEGFNISDFAWGTASAQPVTLSFKVYSSLTGTFGGVVQNNTGNRTYVFSYSIPVANTWTSISISIPGETTGTWVTNNGIGMYVEFGLGVGSTYSGTAGSWTTSNLLSATGATSVVGTNGATFYITGVQLEKGSTATSFDYRPYGTELALCQRYYYKINGSGSRIAAGVITASNVSRNIFNFPVSMRIAPTSLEQSGTAGDYSIYPQATCTSVPQFSTANISSCEVVLVASGMTVNQASITLFNNANAYFGFSSEL